MIRDIDPVEGRPGKIRVCTCGYVCVYTVKCPQWTTVGGPGGVGGKGSLRGRRGRGRPGAGVEVIGV